MKNLLRITPRITQALVNEQASGLLDENGNAQAPVQNNIVLGLEDEVLFGKKFKIRITSKKTGKKMDLNITFTTDVVQSDNEAPPTGYVPPVIAEVAANFGNTAGTSTPQLADTSTSFQAEPDVGAVSGPGTLDQLGTLETGTNPDVITASGGGGGSGY